MWRPARLFNKQLAAQVGLAPSSCLARVRRLEPEGTIGGYSADLDPGALDLGLQALIAVHLRVHVDEASGIIGEHPRSLPEAAAVYCLGGTIDFLVHVVCRDTEHLRILTIKSFTSRPEVSRIETSLVFSFARGGLPIEGGGPEPARAAGKPTRTSSKADPARRRRARPAKGRRGSRPW